MANIYDYLEWRGDLSFKAAPFNPVDNIIFSIISYFPFEGIFGKKLNFDPVPLKKAFADLDKAMQKNSELERFFIFPEETKNFFAAIMDAKRYHNTTVCAHINKINTKRELQFSAITFIDPDCLPYIAFRGTDVSILGWKEDFNMIFSDTIPAQTEAVNYLKKVAPRLNGKYNVGGHSKGGNLAVYASSFCGKELQGRIKTIYNNDAPGFSKKIITSAEHKNIKMKIDSYIPQDSVIGLLFEHDVDFTVVKSTATGFMQHNPFLWQVRRDNMENVKNITRLSKFFNRTLMDWLASMDMDRRKEFIKALYEILHNAKIRSFSDFNENVVRNTGLLIKSLTNLDKESKDMLNTTFAALFNIAGKNITAVLKRKMAIKK